MQWEREKLSVRKEMPISLSIDDYGRQIGGVDMADQSKNYYDTQLTSFHTW